MDNLEVYPLYSALSHEAQLRAISKPVDGIRRVIISTNIAETSLTIPGVRIVIDSGVVKTK
jgi:HrpA-like RNA helicase